MELLDKHFNRKYSVAGAARLPVLAIYSVYECMMDEVKDFPEKNSSTEITRLQTRDRASRDIVGKVIVNFRGRRSKARHQITEQMHAYAYSKFKDYPVNRYYLLSTAGIKDGEESGVNAVSHRAATEHGCQFIINGVMHSLDYLRLLENTDKFLDNYIKNVIADPALKFEHKNELQKLLAQKAVA